jgi:hypothetical protein
MLAHSHNFDAEVQQIVAQTTYVLSVFLRTLHLEKDPHGHLEVMHKFVPQELAGWFPLVLFAVP